MFDRRQTFVSSNPLVNAALAVAGVVMLVLMITLGFFVFLAFVALLVFAGASLGVRNWWLQRRKPPSAATHDNPAKSSRRPVIEGEYIEISRDNGRDTEA